MRACVRASSLRSESLEGERESLLGEIGGMRRDFGQLTAFAQALAE